MTIVMRGSPAGGDNPQEVPPANQQNVENAENGQGDSGNEQLDDQEPPFPVAELNKLDEMINRTRWVVPVLPKGELEILLEAAIKLTKDGTDIKSEPCQRFLKEGLTTSFTKILTDEAVSGWKYEIHRCILKNAEKLVELCVTKLSQDWFPLLELLAIVLNPQCKFHSYNGTRQSETIPPGSNLAEDALFARTPDTRTAPRGWLVDLVNKFGQLNGFQMLLERFTTAPSLSVPVVASLLKPFGQCAEVLTPHTVQKYFMPIVDVVPKFLDNLSDEELKKESKAEAKNDALSSIIKALKYLVYRLPDQEETIKSLEIFRLKMILRLLQISSFNGKMNALNEVNKVIANVSFHQSRHSQADEDEWLTAEKMAEWIQQNGVLSIVLRDSLHQPQYVEKLEKILRFMIKEKALTLQDLDKLWEAQAGKHEAIVKNVHDLLAKLAWDFSPDQLDHLFECFQTSWAHASKKQREKLLELIRRLAEDDKEGVMAHKVLTLLWNLAHSEDVPTEIMDQALAAHIKILDYSCSQDRDSQKIHWINKFVEELKFDKWVLPALKQIREICALFLEPPQNYPHVQRTPHIYYRNNVINQLQNQHSIVMLVAQNLSVYMVKARDYSIAHPDEDPSVILPDGRFNHVHQVQERLRFLRFLLKDGQLWLCEPQARQIWQCLAENAIYVQDRESCFRWFAKLMGEEPDLDPEITRDFFEKNILQLDPSLMTENGMNCFERFFKSVNFKENKLIVKRRGGHMMNDLELIGLDYLWRVVLWSPDEVAEKAITLLKDIYTNLGPNLQQQQLDIHSDFIQTCIDRLKASYDTVSILEKDKDSMKRVMQETTRMVRILTVLKEYVAECDEAYGEERTILPLSRACRGKFVTLLVRFPNQGRQVEDLEVWTHTNDTVGSVRRQILHRVKANASNFKVDLYMNGDNLDPSEDKRLISQVPLRDKMVLQAKLMQVGNNMPSSPDSSSDSSTGSPHNTYDGPNIEAENSLPGVLMSTKSAYAQFLFQLSELGCQLQVPKLRDVSRAVLKLMPSDIDTAAKLKSICQEHAKSESGISQQLENMFFGGSATQTIYCLEVCYSVLMPGIDTHSEDAFEFQCNFVQSGGVQIALNMLTKNNFLSSADLTTRRSAYLNILKICKLMLTTVGHAKVQAVVEAFHADPQSQHISVTEHNQAVVLQQALHHIPHPSAEYMTRSIAMRLGQQLGEKGLGALPDISTVKCLQKLAWATSAGSFLLISSSVEEIHKAFDKAKDCQHNDGEDIALAREALEVLTIALALCPAALEMLNKDKSWQTFIIDLLIFCKNRMVRISAAEQFLLMATRCSYSGHRPLIFFITLLFTVLTTTAKENAKQSHEYFQLLCRLLNFACSNEAALPTAEVLLNNEITWLKKIRELALNHDDAIIEEALLEGHLGITRELLAFQSSDKKFQLGSEKGGANLLRELVEDFVFPASKIVSQCRKQNDFPSDQAVAICCTPQSLIAAYDLMVALCTGCVQNLKYLASVLIDMFYAGDTHLNEWEYLPLVGPRPYRGFVGLKNAGATCYMNSVMQQLFMITSIRQGMLKVEGAADEIEDDFGTDEPVEGTSEMTEDEQLQEKYGGNKDEERKDYNMGVLRQIQLIFGQLACSKLQYYVPRGFWKHFKLWGEPVNLREQHDALEFFNSLVDSLDESLKGLGYPQILSSVLGGSFADQKICKDCPHRYQREEPFTTLNIDIRNHTNLLESLEQYVKGDLLEGANAYQCEKCNKKVDTVKRLVIKKLPKILAIQLKRFDYDWERECAIKFNDYFEFPREFDMEPFTVQGLAKIEGEIIDVDCDSSSQSTKYKLFGVVVHSGSASGGHYYSYILHKGADGTAKWYKFDDGDVCECKMEDDEEIRNQCFGGEYLGEVFDHMLKRMALRRQKRWWNAYILFYERVDENEKEAEVLKGIQDLTISNKTSQVKMPIAIEKCVRKQNILFMHEKNQFCVEYFQFVKKLLTCNHGYLSGHCVPEKTPPEVEQIAMISVELGAKFLFNVGFRTKKTLRGSANEWYEAISLHLRCTKPVRSWFAQNVLFSHPSRFSEYLLECPSSEVRSAFSKIIVILAHFSLQDGSCPPPLVHGLYAGQVADPNATLSDHLLQAVLSLLNKEVSEHGRHLQQYFHLFLMYSNLGIPEKKQLLQLDLPNKFMKVAIDQGPGPPIKYQYAELGKLYSVVSHLIRCCDVSMRCQSSNSGQAPVANPHGDPQCSQALIPIPATVAQNLYDSSSYVKKLIEESTSSDDTVKLLRFCCWENPLFSSTVLTELLWQIAYSYTYELRPYLDLLLQMLLLEDSWQNHRIHNAFKGIPEDRDGLFDTIQRSKNHYQKRAYQCIKMMVSLFSHCMPAAQMLQTNGDLKRKWTWAVEWLNDELERRPYPGNAQYTYNNWSPPAQSNETSNGYFLERSHSAKMTLAKAIELCPEEEPEDGELTDDGESTQLDDQTPPVQQQQSTSTQPQQHPQSQQQPTQTQPPQSQQGRVSPAHAVPPTVQNNQVNLQYVAHVSSPSNQINNQLNQTQPQQNSSNPESETDGNNSSHELSPLN